MPIIVNSVLPVFAMIALGTLLRRTGLIDAQFARGSDRLVYYIFFPALLFLKTSTPAGIQGLDWRLVAAVFCAVAVTCVVSLVYVKLASVDRHKVGSFSQVCFRFSTYVGMALIIAALGQQGGSLFALIIGPTIPFINVLSVGTLIWFSGQRQPLSKMVPIFLRELILNPLILACVLGITYSRTMPRLPLFVENTLGLTASLALPLALVSVGASLTLGRLKEHFRLALVANTLKLVFLPVVGYVMLKSFGVSGLPFSVAMLYFCLPTSPAIFILSSQLDSDVDLAAAGITLSVMLSIVSLSVAVVLFVGR